MFQSRTHTCNELRMENVGEKVKIVGWMENVREVGNNFAFVVVRDFYGTTQVVVENAEMMGIVKSINKESTISVEGVVRERASKNPKLPTGDIEVGPEKIEILGKCRYNELPFEINRSREADETQRLKYRYLDLRNPVVKQNIILLRNAFEGVPSEIEEAAIVDGASEFQVLRQVYIPMSKSTIATVALFFAISRWNGYFWARQMISNSNEHPLQVFIRLQLEQYTDPEFMAGWNEVFASDSMIYALIVCSIVPILVIYPFIQKYFAKGVNVGGVKE